MLRHNSRISPLQFIFHLTDMLNILRLQIGFSRYVKLVNTVISDIPMNKEDRFLVGCYIWLRSKRNYLFSLNSVIIIVQNFINDESSTKDTYSQNMNYHRCWIWGCVVHYRWVFLKNMVWNQLVYNDVDFFSLNFYEQIHFRRSTHQKFCINLS